jgi:hypothetical protein
MKKLSRIKVTGPVVYIIVSKNIKGNIYLGNLNIDGIVLLKWNFRCTKVLNR